MSKYNRIGFLKHEIGVLDFIQFAFLENQLRMGQLVFKVVKSTVQIL